MEYQDVAGDLKATSQKAIDAVEDEAGTVSLPSEHARRSGKEQSTYSESV